MQRDIDELLQYVKVNTSLAVNMDFIAGLPHQTMQNMVENMDYVCQKSAGKCYNSYVSIKTW